MPFSVGTTNLIELLEGYVWLCRAMYGCVGLCRAIYGYAGLCMAKKRLCMAM